MYSQVYRAQQTNGRVALIQEKTASVSLRHLPSQSSLAEIISKVIENSTLSTSKLRLIEPQTLSQETSSWPKKESNTHIDNLEIRNVNITCQKPPEHITQGFSMLNRHISVIAQCKRFIGICRYHKANRESTILSTKEFDPALNCCVKMVKQISYAQETKNLQ